MVEIFLKNNDYDVSFAKNGRSALHLINKTEFDLLITDVQMPEMDGLTLIEELNLKKYNIPILIVSAFGQERLAQEALKIGALKILSKPFDSKTLIASIEEHISSKN